MGQEYSQYLGTYPICVTHCPKTQIKCCISISHQECIPLGCIPSAVVAISGGCLSRGVSAWTCLPRGSVCLGVCTPPPVDRMTDSCENITFPQLLLWTVMILCKSSAICVERFRLNLSHNFRRFSRSSTNFSSCTQHQALNFMPKYVHCHKGIRW